MTDRTIRNNESHFDQLDGLACKAGPFLCVSVGISRRGKAGV